MKTSKNISKLYCDCSNWLSIDHRSQVVLDEKENIVKKNSIFKLKLTYVFQVRTQMWIWTKVENKPAVM